MLKCEKTIGSGFYVILLPRLIAVYNPLTNDGNINNWVPSGDPSEYPYFLDRHTWKLNVFMCWDIRSRTSLHTPTSLHMYNKLYACMRFMHWRMKI